MSLCGRAGVHFLDHNGRMSKAHHRQRDGSYKLAADWHHRPLVAGRSHDQVHIHSRPLQRGRFGPAVFKNPGEGLPLS
jgi:hypothetical protein